MFSAMQNVVPSHMADINLFDFKGIKHGDAVVDGGDLAFDRESLPLQPVGWRADEEDAPDTSARLDVIQIK
jgi:tRNA 2-thiocytidine biosynthesis protein TtcA